MLKMQLLLKMQLSMIRANEESSFLYFISFIFLFSFLFSKTKTQNNKGEKGRKIITIEIETVSCDTNDATRRKFELLERISSRFRDELIYTISKKIKKRKNLDLIPCSSLTLRSHKKIYKNTNRLTPFTKPKALLIETNKGQDYQDLAKI